MSASPPLSPQSHPGQTFVLYAVRGRIYASNVRGKLVDLGGFTDDEDEQVAYRLDGDDHAAGHGFDSVEEALQHLATTVTFLFLDGQFTALDDAGGVERPDLAGAPQIQVTLDPRGRADHAIAPVVPLV